MFPISDPESFIAVMERKEKGRDEEIGVIHHLADLSHGQKDLVINDLKLAHFLPEITEVKSVRSASEGDKWDVITDRGPRTFTVKSPRENTAVTVEGVTIVTDEHRMRYRITNIPALDRKSQAELQKAQI